MRSYEVSRSTSIAAPIGRVHALINDFHEWEKWSPWEDTDPDMERTYSGPESGVGSRYSWSGNKKAGEGSMEITSDTPGRVGVHLYFVKPFKSESDVDFTLTSVGSGTDVIWRLQSEWKGLMALVGRFMPMDKWLGTDFEKGLAKLKAVAEN